MQPNKTGKIAFVCSGGGMKAGAFHLGVALALEAKGFQFYSGPQSPTNPFHFNQDKTPESSKKTISIYVGSSAGAAIVTYLVAGYPVKKIFDSFFEKKKHLQKTDTYLKSLPPLTYQKLFKIFDKKRLKDSFFTFSDYENIKSNFLKLNLTPSWLRFKGLFSTYGLEKYFREEVLVSNQFKDYPADLFIIATSLDESKKVIFSKYDNKNSKNFKKLYDYQNQVSIANACAASMALPLLFVPHKIETNKNEKKFYIDGEIRDTLSTHVALNAGADLVIASYTHQPYTSGTGPTQIINHGLPAILIQTLYLLVEQKIVLARSMEENSKIAIKTALNFLKEHGISKTERIRFSKILEKQLDVRLNSKLIYIHPPPTNQEMFFGEHFSISKKTLMKFLRVGFHSAIQALNQNHF